MARTTVHALLVAGLFALATVAPSARAVSTAPELPYTRYTLPNGLTVVVHEDHKAPVVAVSVWYHVGSKNEPAARSGFAHLFEHLMFQGSENHRDEFFRPFERAGATDQNGTTWLDRTNYFETVPTTALDMALWMESDRMGHLLGAIGQKDLDEQRGVVQNEKRQGENQPYGRVFTVLQANAFPANHPYHHTTIGSMADLNAASLDEVKDWFREYYGAANATVVLAGDITPAAARAKMLQYFGDIAPGPVLNRPPVWVAERSGSSRAVMPDKVPQTRLYREWNVPQLGTDAAIQLDLAATVLAGGKTSRLYQRLVYRDKLADSVSMGVMNFQLASMALLQVSVRQGVDPARVEAAVADEWARFLKDGPSADELARARTQAHAGFLRGIEKVGGFGGQATVLAEGQVYRGDPGAWRLDFQRMDAATPATVRVAAQRWLAQGDFTLLVQPRADVTANDVAYQKLQVGLPVTVDAPAPVRDAARTRTTAISAVDRKAGVPEVARFPTLSFPTLQRATLRNGIPVVLAERHTVPLVQVQMLFDAGYAADQGRSLGTSGFTMAMLDEGTRSLDSLAIARQLESLGAELDASAGLDFSSVYVNALDAHLDDTLKLYADVIRNPAYRDGDLERVRAQWLARIAQEKAQPAGLALRTLPPLLYGKGHAYAIPFTGSGTEASIQSLRREDLIAFQRDWLRPDNARIVVVGDTTLAAVLPRLEAVFGDWQAPATPQPRKSIATVAAPGRPRVFLMDRPGSPQALILAGVVAPPTTAPDNLAIQTANAAFGGTFTSRLNMNLREDKHWAYGAFSLLRDAVGQRALMIYAPVQTDKAAASAAEILAESRVLDAARPLTAEEIVKIKDGDVRSLPGEYETGRAVLGAVTGILEYRRPDDWVQTTAARIGALGDAEVQAAARKVVQPQHYTWVIVGDLKQIEAPIRALDLGAVQVIGADGTVLR